MADTTYYDLPYPASTGKVSLGYKNIQDLAEQIDAILFSANLPIVGNTATVLRSDTAFTSAVTGTYNSLVLNTAVALPNGMTATTQAQSDGSTKVATTAYVDSYITGTVPDGSITTAKLAAGAVTNVKVDAAAAIAYSKLNLASSITSSDIVDGTIVNADVNAAAGITYAKLSLTGGIVNADVSASAAISYSKLNLATSIVNADVSASAAIAYSKLALTGAILNADLAGSIAPAKITGTAVVTADSRLSDARTPTSHASTHIPGGTDVLNFSAFSGQGSSLPGSLTLYPAGSLFAVGAAAPYLIYRSNGSSWDQLGASAITTSDTAPASPQAGDLWYQSSTGKQFIRYDSFWVEMGNNTNAIVPAVVYFS